MRLFLKSIHICMQQIIEIGPFLKKLSLISAIEIAHHMQQICCFQ